MPTVDELKAELATLKAARDAILAGAQSYNTGSRSITRANFAEVVKEIRILETRIGRKTRKGRAVKAPLFGA